MSIIAKLLSVLAILLGLLLAIGGFVLEVQILIVFGIATVISCILYLFRTKPDKLSVADQVVTGFDIVLLTSFPALVVLTRRNSGLEPQPRFYYAGVIILTTLIAVRIILRSDWRPLLHISLLSLIVRGSIWNQSFKFGTDTLFHVGIVGYIVETGERIPAEASYYHHFPGGHFIAAFFAEISSVSPEQAFIYSIGIPAALTPVIISFVTYSVFEEVDMNDSVRTANFAGLFFFLSSFHYIISALLITQVAASILFAIAILLIYKRDIYINRRITGLSILMVISAVTIHNLTPLLICLLYSLNYVSGIGVAKVRNRFGRFQPSNVIPQLSGIISLGVLTYTYLAQIGYLPNVVNRALAIILLSTNSLSEATNPQGGAIPTTDLFGLSISPLVQLALTPIVQGVLVGVAVLITIEKICENNISSRLLEITAVGVSFFIILGIVLAAGLQSGTRGFIAVSLVIAPILGYHYSVLARDRRRVIMIIAILLIPIATYGLLANPNAAATSSSAYKPLYTEGEVASLSFAQSSDDQTFYTDRWMERTAEYNKWPSGEANPDNIKMYAQSYNITSETLQEFQSDHSDDKFIFKKTYFTEYEDVDIPNCYQVIYTSGDAEILHPRCN